MGQACSKVSGKKRREDLEQDEILYGGARKTAPRSGSGDKRGGGSARTKVHTAPGTRPRAGSSESDTSYSLSLEEQRGTGFAHHGQKVNCCYGASSPHNGRVKK